MKFFLPHATDREAAERAYVSIREFVAGQVGLLTEKRIYRIQFSHDGKRFDLRVGDVHPEIGEPVIAVLEGHIYYICTPNRGVLRGNPYLVGRHFDTYVEGFESEEVKANRVSAS